jgi:hypothetical protein
VCIADRVAIDLAWHRVVCVELPILNLERMS